MRASVTDSASRQVQAGAGQELVDFALEVLPTLRRSDGLYCYDRAFGTASLRGFSRRYSLIVLLGLQQAEAAGLATGVDLDELFARCLDQPQDLTAGDLGLALLADSRRNGEATVALTARVDELIPGREGLESLVGMEVAWLLVGLAASIRHHPGAALDVDRISDHIRHHYAPSGLAEHGGSSRLRRGLPNFATEIYLVWALARVARLRLGIDPSAAQQAERLANRLLAAQRADGAWPWLYDARTARVVEDYEIYTVHQDAMAPMALLELTEVTGDERYAAAARRGLAWSRGANELGVDLHDHEARFAHRSIRRPKHRSRVALGVSAATNVGFGQPVRLAATKLEVNQTCRPYHLGWILEAWAGRDGTGRGGGRV